MRRFVHTSDLFDHFCIREEMRLPCVFSKDYDSSSNGKTVTESVRTMLGDTTFSDSETEEYLSERNIVLFNTQVVTRIGKW
jgi:hypothetical protein